MAENFLKYTSLTYDDINRQVSDKLNADSRFDNPRDSAIFKTITDVFVGCTDLVNYYISRRAEECFFDTAQLKSSFILLARQLGYVVSRPIPAKSKLKIKLQGDFTSSFDRSTNADNKIQIPYYSSFSYDNNNYVLIDTFTYNVTSACLNDMLSLGSSFELDIVKDSFGNDIHISQGDIRENVIIGNTNIQVGSNFQMYKIEDKEFSNIYGDKDYFHNDVTQVYIGDDKTSATQYQIDRRSLINWESLSTNDLSEAVKVCLVRTTPDEYIEIIFGDGKFAAKGALTREDNIYIQYLATKGAEGNKVGVIDDNVSFSGKVFTNRGIDITDKVKFKLYANITGGADIEENDSIKYSAPKIYYSLDRLVSKSDYIHYLKTLKSPIVVQNALAWGEQEERDLAGVFADVKMFNVALFSVVGSLYNLDGDTYSVKTVNDNLSDAVLDLNYDPYEFEVQSYFNVYTRQALAHQLKKYDVLYYYKKIQGLELSATASPSYFNAAYGNNGRFTFAYKTDTVEYASNISATDTVVIDCSSFTNASTMDDVATKINTEMESFDDIRANQYDNTNYNSAAFTNGTSAIVTWDNDNRRFEFRFEEDSPCYIEETSGSFALDIGIVFPAETVASLEYEEMSGKIVEVVDDLNTKGQLNVKSIYISPMIHNFNVEGTVYVKALYDKEELRTTLNNKIYSWLDMNADFNESLYISNIVNQLEVHPGIVHADIKLIPEDITAGVNNVDNRYYYGWTEPLLVPYGGEMLMLFLSHLSNYLDNTSTYPEIDETRKFYTTSWWEVELSKKVFSIHNYINERSFLNVYLKTLFDELLHLAEIQKNAMNPAEQNNYYYRDVDGNFTPNYRRFIGYTNSITLYNTVNRFFAVSITCDFIKVITKIRKDLSYIIGVNMLDSNGNIHVEYDTEDNYLRGGYSLGCEIVKVNLQQLNYEYK